MSRQHEKETRKQNAVPSRILHFCSWIFLVLAWPCWPREDEIHSPCDSKLQLRHLLSSISTSSLRIASDEASSSNNRQNLASMDSALTQLILGWHIVRWCEMTQDNTAASTLHQHLGISESNHRSSAEQVKTCWTNPATQLPAPRQGTLLQSSAKQKSPGLW